MIRHEYASLCRNVQWSDGRGAGFSPRMRRDDPFSPTLHRSPRRFAHRNDGSKAGYLPVWSGCGPMRSGTLRACVAAHLSSAPRSRAREQELKTMPVGVRSGVIYDSARTDWDGGGPRPISWMAWYPAGREAAEAPVQGGGQEDVPPQLHPRHGCTVGQPLHLPPRIHRGRQTERSRALRRSPGVDRIAVHDAVAAAAEALLARQQTHRGPAFRVDPTG